MVKTFGTTVVSFDRDSDDFGSLRLEPFILSVTIAF
jgi:hypothetical protein